MTRVDDTVRLAWAVDGARFVSYHHATHRVFVWREGNVLDVVRVDTGEVIGNWPCEADADSAAAVVADRTNMGY